MFIGFGVIVAFKTGNFFYLEQSPFAYPMAAITFGAAIILIARGGGDLLTGNTFYYTYAALKKKMQWDQSGEVIDFQLFGQYYRCSIFCAINLCYRTF